MGIQASGRLPLLLALFAALLLILLLPLLFFGYWLGSDDETGFIIKNAPIHDVDIRFAESFPVQVFVYVKGGLSDGCTRFNDYSITRVGDAINISVTTIRSRGAFCTQVYGFFEQNIPIGSDFVSGQTYVVRVNDYQPITFIMQ